MNQTTATSEDKVAFLFQPDSVIPAQYFETFRRKGHLEPEKRLMLAILEDAIACFQNYIFAQKGKKRDTFLEAAGWILEKKSDWLFSFNNICEVLGFNPVYVRSGLLRWKENRLDHAGQSQGLLLNVRIRRPERGSHAIS